MMSGCLKRIFGLAVLAALLVGGWFYRDRITGLWSRTRAELAPEEVRASADLAEQADRKLSSLANGEQTQIALTGQELQSLLHYRYAQLLPAFVDSPRVEIEASRIRLRVRVPVDKLPRVSELGEAAAFLPDTTDLAITGQLLPLDSGRIALAVDEVSAASIPLPRRLVPGALTRLGRKNEPGLPPDALALPLPPGAAAAYVRGDSLFLLSRPSRPIS
jgi:hypothetical protein